MAAVSNGSICRKIVGRSSPVSDDSSVCVWDMESKRLLEKNSDSNARVMDVESGNDRSWVLSADMAGCLRMRTKSIDAESPTNRLVAMHKDGIESVTSCVGEKLIAAGTRGGAIHLYTMDSELVKRTVQGGHGSGLVARSRRTGL